MARNRYVYRLDITYPPGSRIAGWMPPNWRDIAGAYGVHHWPAEEMAKWSDAELLERVPFKWPRERLFLTRDAMAVLGCTFEEATALVRQLSREYPWNYQGVRAHITHMAITGPLPWHPPPRPWQHRIGG